MMLKNSFGLIAIACTVFSGFANAQTTPRTNSQVSNRAGYRVVNVKQFVSQNSISALNPNQAAVKLFADAEEAEGRSAESLNIKYSRANTAVILITKEGLGDDSVRSLRKRIEMRRTANGKWEVIWVGEQYKCQKGRGSQTWTAKLCS